MTLYMAVTADKYELPIDFESKATALSRKLGLRPNFAANSINKNIQKTILPDKRRVKFCKVELDDESKDTDTGGAEESA